MKLEVKDIKKSFEGKEILHGINFEVESGKALGLLGRNGAGKTTSIRIIMDVFHADSGEVLLDGDRFKPDGRKFGYLPEERGLYPKRVVKEQLIYLGMLRGLSKKEASANTEKWLKRLGVDEYTDKKLDTLSKGNQQKVQLAATLVGEPEIVILDEPFSGLDPVNSQILKDVIRELIEEGRIVIFSSHQMSYVEEFCENIAIINKGEVVLKGHLDDIKTEYGKGRKKLAASNMSLDEVRNILESKLFSMVRVERVSKHHVIFECKGTTSGWDILEALKKENVEIKSFGDYEPSLNDIFVTCVGEEESEEEASYNDKNSDGKGEKSEDKKKNKEKASNEENDDKEVQA
ncbi:MAG: ATP-binding cassette domain-containing protein [Lachnospiraceae bacterium]|nr:ATP-binding cassette domain-containing protein [Lachnospiraceae bacterium]